MDEAWKRLRREAQLVSSTRDIRWGSIDKTLMSWDAKAVQWDVPSIEPELPI